MSESTSRAIRFESSTGLPLEAAFEAGRLTSDGGLPWVGEADRALGLCDLLAGCIPDWRQRVVRHDLATLVRQRVYQIACGYADQNDADTLRGDPLLKLVCGRRPVSGADLASQPTFSRLENAVDRHAIEALARALVAVYIRGDAAARRDASCSTWTGPTTRPTGTRRGCATTGTTASTCTIRCWCSTATPAT
jgi:hypothetical protein